MQIIICLNYLNKVNSFQFVKQSNHKLQTKIMDTSSQSNHKLQTKILKIPKYSARIIRIDDTQSNQKQINCTKVIVERHDEIQQVYEFKYPEERKTFHLGQNLQYVQCNIKQIPKVPKQKPPDEIQITNHLKHFRHNNVIEILSVFYIGEIGGIRAQNIQNSFFIITEIREKAVTIDKFLQKNKITQKQSLQILVQIVDAMHFLRSKEPDPVNINNIYLKTGSDNSHFSKMKKSIVYGDLKPQNILIQSYNGKLAVKLINFQSSKFLQPSQQTLDQKIDTYMFGEAIFYLLTRKTYISKSDVQQAIKMKDLSKQWNELLQNSLSQKPTERYQISKIRELLKNYLSELDKEQYESERNKIIRINNQEQIKEIKEFMPFFTAKIIQSKNTCEVEIYEKSGSSKPKYCFNPFKDLVYNHQRKKEKGNSIIYDRALRINDQQRQQFCVIKQIPVFFQPNLKYIRRQVQALKLLKNEIHKNIINVFDIFYIDEVGTQNSEELKTASIIEKSFDFVMQNYQGALDLSKWVGQLYKKNKRLDQQKILEIFQQIIQGVDFIHTKIKAVHRDLKLENILIFQDDGGKTQVKIIDFGLTRSLDQINKYAVTLVGTYGYIPPEILQDKEYKLNYKYDLWSLGCILFYLLSKNQGQLLISKSIQDLRRQMKQVNFAKKIKQVTENKAFEKLWSYILQKTLVRQSQRATTNELKNTIKEFQSGLLKNTQTKQKQKQQDENKLKNNLIIYVLQMKPVSIQKLKLLSLIVAQAVIFIRRAICMFKYNFNDDLCRIGLKCLKKLYSILRQLRYSGRYHSYFIESCFKTNNLSGQQYLKRISSYKYLMHQKMETKEQIVIGESTTDSTQLNLSQSREALEIINAQLKKLWIFTSVSKELNLQGKQLREIPFQNNEFVLDQHNRENLQSIKYLHLNDNQIYKIENLQNLTQLTMLFLNNNQITKIEGLQKLVNLQQLILSENKIEKIEGLDQLVNLKEIQLNKNEIEKIQGLEKLKNLEILQLCINKIEKIEGLENLNRLKILSLQGNQITKIEDLQNLKNLKQLDLSYNLISKIQGINQLEYLVQLQLAHNRISKIEDLRSSIHLKLLNISNNKIKNLSQLPIWELDTPQGIKIIHQSLKENKSKQLGYIPSIVF